LNDILTVFIVMS